MREARHPGPGPGGPPAADVVRERSGPPVGFAAGPRPGEARDGVAVRRHGRLVEVVLDRPRQRNALDLAMWRRVAAVFDDLGASEDLGVVVLRGAGGNLSAGSDITGFPIHRTGIAAADGYNAAIDRALTAVTRVPIPMVAMIAGLAVGGGCELACAADLRVAASDARLGVPIARLGVSIGAVEARTLLRVLGPARLKDLLLTGRLVDATEAYRIGLVDRVVASGELAAATWELASQIANGAPLAAVANKLVVDAVSEGNVTAHRARLRQLTTAIYDGPDLEEGIRAFTEKRAPRFAQRRPAARGRS